LIQRQTAIVDSSVLFASIDRTDAKQEQCAQAIQTRGVRLVVPTLTICEILYLIGQHLGTRAETTFLRWLDSTEVLAPAPEERDRIAALVHTYRSLPLGGVDASIIVFAERLNTDVIYTLDRRHFSVVRPRHVPTFRLLPE